MVYHKSNVLCVQYRLKVVPVIGILSDKKSFHPCPNPDEVEAIFDAPLEMFIKVGICFIN